MANTMAPRHPEAWLPRIELPRVEIEHDGPPILPVHAPNAEPRERRRQQSKVAAAADREVHAEHTRGADRELDERSGIVSLRL